MFAKYPIAKRFVVQEYTGKVYKREEAQGIVTDNRYLADCGGGYVIDGKGQWSGKLNHSRVEANTVLQKYPRDSRDKRGGNRLFLVTKHDVNKDEELLFDYGEKYWEGRQDVSLYP